MPSSPIDDIPRLITLPRGAPLSRFSTEARRMHPGRYALCSGVYLRGIEDTEHAKPAIWDVIWAASDEFAELLFTLRPVSTTRRTWPTPSEQHGWTLGTTYARILERADRRYGSPFVREGATYRIMTDGSFAYRHLDTPEHQSYYFLTPDRLLDEEPFAISWRLKPAGWRARLARLLHRTSRSNARSGGA